MRPTKNTIMGIIILILISLTLLSCGEPNSKQKATDLSVINFREIVKESERTKDEIYNLEVDKECDYNSESYRQESLNMSFKKNILYNLNDTIEADFNGDGHIDKVFYKKENATSGIIIIHGQINEEIRFGFGKSFAHLTDFNWIDYWGLMEDKETYETTFSKDGDILGTKEVVLQNPSIFVGIDEGGGGLITFINGKYEWIHQAD